MRQDESVQKSLRTLVGPRISLRTRSNVVLKLLEDVRTRLEFWRFDAASRRWTRQDGGDGADVPVGQDVSVASHCRDASADNTLWLFRDGFLVPDAMEMASMGGRAPPIERTALDAGGIPQSFRAFVSGVSSRNTAGCFCRRRRFGLLGGESIMKQPASARSGDARLSLARKVSIRRW